MINKIATGTTLALFRAGMMVSSFLPSASASNDITIDGETAAGECSESAGFSDWLASLAAAVGQVSTAEEGGGEGKVDAEAKLADNDRPSQAVDEVSVDLSSIPGLLTPMLSSVGARESTPSGVGAATDSSAEKDSQAENAQISFAAGDGRPLVSAGDDLSVENSANPAGEKIGVALRSSAVKDSSRRTAASDTETLKPVDFAPSGKLSSMIDDQGLDQIQMREADTLGKTLPTLDGSSAQTKDSDAIDKERRVDPAERQTIESLTVDGEAAEVKAKARPFHRAADSQFSFAKQHGESFSEHAEFTFSETPLDRQSPSFFQSVVQIQPDLALAPRHETGSDEIAAQTAWQPVLERVAEEIVSHARLGKHEAVIQLDPPELGKIKIDLRLEGEQIHALIVAEEQGTKALIENHLAELRQAFDARAVDCASVRVEQQGVSNGGDPWAQGFNDGPQHGEGRGQTGAPDRTFNDSAPTENSQRRPIDSGRISMWA